VGLPRRRDHLLQRARHQESLPAHGPPEDMRRIVRLLGYRPPRHRCGQAWQRSPTARAPSSCRVGFR
jgi:hypothetical protein